MLINHQPKEEPLGIFLHLELYQILVLLSIIYERRFKNAKLYTRRIIKKDFKDVDKGIFGGLLRSGLYILGATSKVGKTMIATSLANAVATGIEYLEE